MALRLLENTDYSESFQKLLLMDYYLDDEINSIDDFYTYINNPSITNEFSDYSTNTVKLSEPPNAVELKQYHLDPADAKSFPLEIALFDTINFNGTLTADWIDITNNRLKECISPEFQSKLKGVAIFKLSVDIVNRFNNHLEYVLNKNIRSFVKIKEVNIISFENNVFIGGIRFQFKNRQLSLQDVMEILTKLPHIKRTDKKRNYFSTNQGIFSPHEFIGGIFSEALGGKYNFQNKRARRMTFIRAEECIFENQNTYQSIFSRFAAFNNHAPNSVKEPDFESITLDYDSILSVSEKGSIALCGATPKNNSDFLPNEFMRYYFLNYLINWYRQITEHKLQKYSDSDICNCLENNFSNLFQRKYLNLYSEAAYNHSLY